MKYFSLIILLFLSKFTNGQNAPRVESNFDNIAVFDDFSYATDRWEQNNTSTERLIISDNKYRVERLVNSYFTVALTNDVTSIADFDIEATIILEHNSSNKFSSGGLIFKAQRSGDGAILFEINRYKQFRVSIMKKGVIHALFSDENNGWIKSKNLSKKGENKIRIVTKGNVFDVYLNGKFQRSFIETSYKTGRIGFFANSLSSIEAHSFILKTDGLIELSEKQIDETGETENSGGDETYTELVKLFRDKIDKQNQEIQRLNQEITICKSNLSLDTSSANAAKSLEKENAELKQQLDSKTNQLNQANKRLAYLESMKEDIEAQTNGDIILHLTKLLSEQKEETNQLKEENKKLKEEIRALESGN